jgi:thiamine-monophosphate kinase
VVGEFDLIARIRARAGARDDVMLGIGDDAALLAPRSGELLAVATDTLNAGIHFPHDTPPADLGWKALAVNLSDLAAMAAEPAWCALSLSLPESDAAWLDAFLDGFLDLADRHGVSLVGGDTTRGPLSVCVTVHGFVPAGMALRRDAAREGDDLWITGTPGDAAAALTLLGHLPDSPHARPSPTGSGGGARVRQPAHASRALPADGAGNARVADAEVRHRLRTRLDRPTPRVAAGLALRGLAHACIDVSDGLLADLGHMLRASGVGAAVEIARLPCSPALAASFKGPARWRLQLAGGDDYELLFSAPPHRREAIAAALAAAATPAAVIGRIVAGEGIAVRDPQGRPWTPPRRGYEHFTGDEG